MRFFRGEGGYRSGPVPLVSMVTGPLTRPVSGPVNDPHCSGNRPRRKKIAAFTVNGKFFWKVIWKFLLCRSVMSIYKHDMCCSYMWCCGSTVANPKKLFITTLILETVWLKFTHVYWTCVPSSKIDTVIIWGSGLHMG